MEISKQKDGMGRRSFLDFVIGGLLAIFGGGIIYPVFRYISPVRTEPGAMEDEKFSIPLAEIPEGSAKMVRYKDAPLVIIHSQGKEVVALSATCTHLGCVVKWNEETRELQCPCHGAVFDRFGQVKGGPAPKPLPSFEVRVDGDKIQLV
jgi:cytochrome b6-f complex iron-sulfur subunit